MNFLIASNHSLFQQGFKDMCQQFGSSTFWASSSIDDIESRLSQSPMIDVALIECSNFTSQKDTLRLRKASPLTILVVLLTPKSNHKTQELLEAGVHEIIPHATSHVDILNCLISLTSNESAPSKSKALGIAI